MQFISVEKFKEQPKEVQQVFLDWWQPSIGDLATGRYEKIVAISSQRDVEAVKIYKGEPYAIPFFTEGQLRKFIEDSMSRIALIELDYDTYNIVLRNISKAYITGESDLIQAYWKVACMIAKEGLKNE